VSRTRPLAQVDELVGGLLDAQPLGQGGSQQQARAGDDVGIVEDDVELVEGVAGLHRESALLIGNTAALAGAILPGQRAFLIIRSAERWRRRTVGVPEWNPRLLPPPKQCLHAVLCLVGQLIVEDGNRLEEVDMQPLGQFEGWDDVANRPQHQESMYIGSRPQRTLGWHRVAMVERHAV
jgi:hypothetical protein